MKDITINNYIISGVSRSYSFKLQEKKIDKNGKPYTNNIAYTATLKQALESLLTHQLVNSNESASTELDWIYTKYGLTI